MDNIEDVAFDVVLYELCEMFFSYSDTAVVIQSDTVVASFIFTFNLKSMDNIKDVAFEVV